MIYSASNIGVRRDFEMWVKGHSRSLEIAPFSRSHIRVPFVFHRISMPASCFVFKIKRNTGIVEKRQFFIPPSFNLHNHLEPLRIFFFQNFEINYPSA